MSQPDVSIVVPVFNRWDLTSACLRSIEQSAAGSRLTAEVLISDDASTDETTREVERLTGRRWPVRYLRNETQLGFLRNCNSAAEQAQGRYLCLLNNDTLVEPAWLDRLMTTIESSDDVGAVGPVFLDGRGAILECGGVVHADGTARQLGHGRPPTDRRYAYLNDVDYISAACLLLRTDLFRELGGFDERYVPAYYEDTDLCLKLAERGLRVVVNPAVRVTHFEGGSHGTSTTSGLKRYQELNREKFFGRWQGRLAAHHPQPFESEDRMRTWRRKDTFAFYYPRPLTHEMDSGALRLYRLMSQLRDRGHHVLLVNPEEEGPRLQGFHGLGIETMRATWGGEDQHLQRLRNAPPAVAIFAHLQSEERFAKSYYEFAPSTIRMFDTVDLHFLRDARGQAIELGLTEEPVLTPLNVSRDGLAELAAGRRSDVTLVVSEAERDLLTSAFFFDDDAVRVVSNVHEPSADIHAYSERAGFAFLAGYAHPPNVDAIIWTVKEVWPLIRRKLPEARLDVYGSSAPREVSALHDPARGVFVNGYVDDHRSALARARVMLAPLRYGAGVKGKLGESLAVGTPVVTTRVGAEGMDTDGLSMAIGHTAQQLADLAIALDGDEADWLRRQAAGFDILAAHFSAARNTEALLTAAEDARHMRAAASPGGLIKRLLWYELGNPGEPQTIEMNFRSLVDRRELGSAAGRAWRYYRTHGLRAASRRIADELRLRRMARGRG